MAQKTRVLFLCTGNSCRSQMAEGWAKSLNLPDYEFYSAGIEAHGMNENAIKVMQESSVDISQHSSKTLAELADVQFDLVYAVCDSASQNCPAFSKHTRMVCHQFDDPPALAKKASSEAEALGCYRRVRDQIKLWVCQEIATAKEIGTAGSPTEQQEHH